MMSAIRQSDSYLWSVQEPVGQGATGTVFICRAKKNGQSYAAKVFNTHAEKRPYEVKIREIEVLRNLQHPNIVKYIALEQEHGSKSTVLVMELCEISLHDILDQPENIYGLAEQDFKDVIQDVSAGMEYLYDRNVVHRDVKPGNILRSEKDYGRFIYQITDFGAARELGETDQFVSVYGTEEYLHPDIYEKAVLKRTISKTFTAAVDLWSLGVTFYHLATGELPFRPFGGRQNKEVMFKMITEKPPGVISVHQSSTTGGLIFASKLPDNTRISQGLKSLMTPILKGLLETSPEYMISRDDFFQKIKDIIQMKTFDFFSTKTSSIHRIYLRHEDNFSNLQDALASQVGINASEQELYHYSKEFKPDLMAPILHYPEMNSENPLILVTDDHNSAGQLPQKTFSSLPPPSNDRANIEDDANMAKVHANLSYSLKRQAEMLLSIRKAIYITHETVESVVDRMFECTHELCHHMRLQITDKYRHLISNKTLLIKLKEQNVNTGESIVPSEEDQKKYNAVIECLSNLESETNDVLIRKMLKEQWVSSNDLLKAKPWLEAMSADVKTIMVTYTRFNKDKSRRHKPTLLDELVHKAEKDRICLCYQRMLEQLSSLTEHRNKLHDQLGNWLNEVRKKKETLLKLKELLDHEVAIFEQSYEEALPQFEAEVSRLLPMTIAETSDSESLCMQLESLVDNTTPELVQVVQEQDEKLKLLEQLDAYELSKRVSSLPNGTCESTSLVAQKMSISLEDVST